MRSIETVPVTWVGFLNGCSPEDSIGRLGQSALESGVSSAAVAALVRLTCQAHGIPVHGLSTDYLDVHLRELKSLKLIHWTGGDTLHLT